MKIDTVFLDAGGVLVHPNWRRVADALARHGVTVDPAALAQAEALARFELDQPAQIAKSTDGTRVLVYFDLVVRHAGLHVPAEVTGAAWAEVVAGHARQNLWEVVDPGTLPGLQRLHALGLRLVVVSNANGTLRAHFDRLGLTPHLDVIIDSHEEGLEKPDPRLFDLALTRAGARRETTVHVGDLYNVDVIGARASGIRPVLFDPTELYVAPDCPRIHALPELAQLIEREAL